MADSPRYFLTTAIDYPNSRPHIGTAFEKIGADVQARYRRMEGYDVFFLMGNDENTVKVSQARRRAGPRPEGLLRRHGPAVPGGLARPRHQLRRLHPDQRGAATTPAAGKFIQKVYDNGYIYKGQLRGPLLRRLRGVQDRERDPGGRRRLPHPQDAARQAAASRATSSPCRSSRTGCWSSTTSNPDFIQPESRRNEVVNLVAVRPEGRRTSRGPARPGASTCRSTRSSPSTSGSTPCSTTSPAIGYGDRRGALPASWWPADVHVIGKDITRFHCALWPAMCMSPPGSSRRGTVFGHGFVYIKNEETGDGPEDQQDRSATSSSRWRSSRSSARRRSATTSCASARSPATASSAGSGSPTLYNTDLANNLGNLYSRVVKLITQNYDGRLEGTAGLEPGVIYTEVDTETTAKQVQTHIEACQYNQALQRIWRAGARPDQPVPRTTRRRGSWSRRTRRRPNGCFTTLAEQLRVVVDPAQAVPAAGGRDDLQQLQLPGTVGGGELRRGVVARPAGRGPQGAGAAARRQGQAAVPAHRVVSGSLTSPKRQRGISVNPSLALRAGIQTLSPDHLRDLGQLRQQHVGPEVGVLELFRRGLERSPVAGEQGGAHAEAAARRQVLCYARADVQHLGRADPLLVQGVEGLAEQPLRRLAPRSSKESTLKSASSTSSSFTSES